MQGRRCSDSFLTENGDVNKSSKRNVEKYRLQVGGHTQLVSIGSGLVSKPANEREAQFYLVRPKRLDRFLPKFEGIITLPQYPKLRSDQEKVEPILSRFIVLEDLTDRFLRPCVLDIKMGTRVHGDFASPEKIESQRKKCQETTSTRLGARLCGTLWHNPHEAITYKTDKYEGRKLDVDGFEQRLLHFFSDGKCLRKNVVNSLLDKLITLRDVIADMDSYRFYSCSLLVLYEGAEKYKMTTKERLRHLSKRDSFGDDELEDYEDLNQTHCLKPPELVTVKIIDFAHATFDGFLEDQIVHDGPDTGFLKGIDTLIDILSTSLGNS